MWAVTILADGQLSMNLGLLHRDSLHQVAEILVHRPCLQLVWLGDGPKHHGYWPCFV